MSGIYTVLARKWRPHTFDDVVGQEVVVRTLKNALERDRVAHAYLFAGSRGTGKTTIARILSRSLNCVKGPTVSPCGACQPCREILQGNSLDVLEIDGASTRGIDDVRRLREDVKLAPSGGRSKVYIIDEVHMLTQQAFNALLKTLEEPPAHVVFVLATTDPQKLPETILSRCQRYNFSRISVRDTLARLQEVLKGEGVTVNEDALLIVARRAGGALRDALGFLDQVLATGADPIDVATVTDTLGLVGSDLYGELLASFVERDPAKALSVVSDVHRAGHDLEFFVQGLLDMLRNVLVVKTVPKPETVVDVTEEERAHLRETAEELELGDLLRMIRMTVELVDQIRQSDYPWILVEVAVVELASLDRVTDLTTLLKALERGVDALPRSDGASGGGGTTTSATSKPASRSPGTKKDPSGPRALFDASPPKASAATAEANTHAESRVSSRPTMTVIDGHALPEEAWTRTLETIKPKKPLLWSVLTQGELGRFENGVLHFKVDPGNGFHLEQLREPAHIALIQSALGSAYDGDVRFHVELEAGAGADAAPRRQRVLEDPFVKKLLETLDGEIV